MGIAPCSISQSRTARFDSGSIHINPNFHHAQLARILDEIVVSSSFEVRQEAVRAFNRSNRFVKRGIALTPTKFGISFENRFMNQVLLCWLGLA
jgi:xanthine dehydrogenase large subunit